MKNVLKKMIAVFMSMLMAVSALAEVIDTGNGKIDVGNPKIKYGASSTYNPNGTTKSNLKELKKRAKDLRAAKKELMRKKRKAKGYEAKKKVQEEIEKVSKELKKVFDDHDFEQGLTTNPRKPKRRAEARAWKRKERQKRNEKLKEKQKKWEEKQRRRRGRAVNIGDLRDLGDVTIGDISSANTDVTDAQRDFNDIEDQIKEEECEEVNDDNVEICLELGSARTEASAALEDSKLRFRDLAVSFPPILIGGGLYTIYERMTDLQDSYQHLRDVSRELIGCKELCEVVKERTELIENSLREQEALDKQSLNEVQDELKTEEVSVPVDAELIIPNYLAKNTQVPFGAKNELPLIFAIDKDLDLEVVKSAYAVVNDQFIELVYYSEKGVFTGSYMGFEAKEDFYGKLQVELVDGQVLEKIFEGKINSEKPQVEIDSVPGSILRKGKFKIHVTGEFDKIEISGENVKDQTIKFEQMMNSHKMTVKAMSKGAASINVVATRTSKTIEMPEFDGQALLTDEEGRIIRNDDFFQSIDLKNGKKKELGFCCEDLGELTCEGCISGKRTRKSCKALNKLPGYNFKAFLKADDLTCSAL